MLINKKFILTIVLLCGFQFSCSAENKSMPPKLNNDAFDGFTLTKNKTSLSGYEFKNNDIKDVTFNSCEEALNYKTSNIAGYEYFRFKLLLTSCKAINKYKTAKSSSTTFFPTELSKKDYKLFPALATPFLSKTEYNQRQNKTISQYYKSIKVTTKNNTATLLTKEDEIYITILARGDFNNDKIEDLLVSSEWYAVNAHGKHTDLVILSKTGKDKPIKIDWRMNTLK